MNNNKTANLDIMNSLFHSYCVCSAHNFAIVYRTQYDCNADMS